MENYFLWKTVRESGKTLHNIITKTCELGKIKNNIFLKKFNKENEKNVAVKRSVRHRIVHRVIANAMTESRTCLFCRRQSHVFRK